jgi:hypothetical protein
LRGISCSSMSTSPLPSSPASDCPRTSQACSGMVVAAAPPMRRELRAGALAYAYKCT